LVAIYRVRVYGVFGDRGFGVEVEVGSGGGLGVGVGMVQTREPVSVGAWRRVQVTDAGDLGFDGFATLVFEALNCESVVIPKTFQFAFVIGEIEIGVFLIDILIDFIQRVTNPLHVMAQA
jgi:hypothetical protein